VPAIQYFEVLATIFPIFFLVIGFEGAFSRAHALREEVRYRAILLLVIVVLEGLTLAVVAGALPQDRVNAIALGAEAFVLALAVISQVLKTVAEGSDEATKAWVKRCQIGLIASAVSAVVVVVVSVWFL
jgi:amino acid transporter